jgi:protein subunit release factor A
LYHFFTDGGKQEYSTAESCVKAVFPDAKITENRTENYPIKVLVSASVGGTNVEIWSGRQQDLFSKYAKKRKAAMDTMKRNLVDLKEEFE